MIQPNELRIGNWVYYHLQEKNWKLDLDDFCDIANGNSLVSDFSPIPLTPEVLEKCGFKDALLGDDNIKILPYKRRFVNESPQHSICLVPLSIVGSEQNHWAFGIHENDRKIQLAITYVLYLHQLQNLYFALTGEELEYKP